MTKMTVAAMTSNIYNMNENVSVHLTTRTTTLKHNTNNTNDNTD